eukprot:Partr_v1_DN28396_c3_g1_i6_m78452 putative Bud site selection protein
MDGLKTVSEFFETECKESLVARTESLASLRELGPPDLCLLVKAEKSSSSGRNSSGGSRDSSAYHFVTGVDTSSSASIAAYMNSLTYLMPDAPRWFGGASKNPSFTIRSGTYCSWNFFSRVDVRVEVKIPGGVEAYGVDGVNDRRLELTAPMWQEVFVCAALRALLVNYDTPAYPSGFSLHNTQSASFYQHLYLQISIRSLNPFPTPADELKFLDGVQTLFAQGWRLGNSESESVSSTLVNNFFCRAFMHYVTTMSRHDKVLPMFSQLQDIDVDVVSLYAPCLLQSKREVDAVKVWYDAHVSHPLRSSELLLSQAMYLWGEKKNVDLALELVRHAVNIAPTQASPWLLLAELFIEKRDYKNALLSLNSCPAYMSLQDGNSGGSDAVKPTTVFSNLLHQLRTMPSPFKRYVPVNEEASVPAEVLEETKEFIASSVGDTSTPENLINDPLTFFSGAARHRDACDVALFKLKAPFLRGNISRAYSILAKIVHEVGWDQLLMTRSQVFVMEEEYKAVRQQISQTTAEEESVPSPVPLRAKPWHGSSQLTVSMFNNKRLCERWFDSLFLILYEDLRVYTIYKAEMEHTKSEKGVYERTPLEWELLGDLCKRLHQHADAKECYQFYVDIRFNFRIWGKLLNLLKKEGKMHLIVTACEKLMHVLDRWKWGDVISPCSPVCTAIYDLVRQHGAEKVKATVFAVKTSKRNEKLFFDIVDWSVKFLKA